VRKNLMGKQRKGCKNLGRQGQPSENKKWKRKVGNFITLWGGEGARALNNNREGKRNDGKKHSKKGRKVEKTTGNVEWGGC